MAEQKTYSISDLSQEFDVTTRTIRFYEEKSLLSPERKGTARIYSSADRTTLKLILRGKRLGFTLEESRDIIESYAHDSNNVEQLQKLIDKIEERKAHLTQQLHDIEVMMEDLNETEHRTRLALEQAVAKELG